MHFELHCDCGNPDCTSHVRFRKGFVQIHHPDGTKEDRWDHFHIDAFGKYSQSGELEWVQLMLPPEDARALLWFLITMYVPGISFVYRQWLSLYYRVDGWRRRIRTRFKK